jgi:DNA polymerase-3 subunit delta'
MAWSSILGHDDVIERLRGSLARGRLAHAYLLVGPEGIGKGLVARELAATVQCARQGDEACGQCPACHKVAHGNHPDVAFVRRIERTAKGARRTQILIDQVREEIQDPIAYKPFEGRYKVFVICDAEQMSEEAQNCLLKTLEEPPPHSLLLLVASRLEPFVDTVVSRCQVLRFRPLPTELAERILVGQHAMDADAARVLARLSGGSPGRALRYADEGSLDTAVWLLGQLAVARPGAEFVVAADLLDTVRNKGDRLEDAREALRPVLALLALAWRDLLFGASGYPPELLAWSGDTQQLGPLGEGLTPARARRLVDRTIEARDQLDANANIKLLVENLLLDLCATLHGREATTVR